MSGGDGQAARCALMFPGQGTQQPRMGEPWRDHDAWDLVEQVSQSAGHDLEELLMEADAETLQRTDLAQLVVFTVSLLSLSALRGGGVPGEVVACAGHSLGEYTALVAAGALSVADGAALVAARGAAMRAAAEERPGTMAVVLGDAAVVAELVAEAGQAGAQVWTANLNGGGQVVVSGAGGGVGAVAELADQRGLRVMRIPVGGAFHTPLMDAAVPALRRALDAVAFSPSHLPVVANADARPHLGEEWRALAERQLTQPVLWERSVRTLVEELGCGLLVEVGPGRTLANLARRISPDARTASCGGPDGLTLAAAPRGAR